MLMDKMRQGAQSLTAKIIFVIIMVSFALAGIGGYAVRKPNTDPVEVDGIAGKNTITALRNALRNELKNVKNSVITNTINYLKKEIS